MCRWLTGFGSVWELLRGLSTCIRITVFIGLSRILGILKILNFSDIAARNCLLSEKEVKITDFGLSRNGPIYKMKTSCKLPVKWLAPETISSLSFSFATDVYRFGIYQRLSVWIAGFIKEISLYPFINYHFADFSYFCNFSTIFFIISKNFSKIFDQLQICFSHSYLLIKIYFEVIKIIFRVIHRVKNCWFFRFFAIFPRFFSTFQKIVQKFWSTTNLFFTFLYYHKNLFWSDKNLIKVFFMSSNLSETAKICKITLITPYHFIFQLGNHMFRSVRRRHRALWEPDERASQAGPRQHEVPFDAFPHPGCCQKVHPRSHFCGNEPSSYDNRCCHGVWEIRSNVWGQDTGGQDAPRRQDEDSEGFQEEVKGTFWFIGMKWIDKNSDTSDNTLISITNSFDIFLTGNHPRISLWELFLLT